MKKLLAYYINPFTDEHKEVAIDDSLKTFYDMLDCDMVEMPYRNVGGNTYSFICDEEGLLKGSDNIRIAACTQSDLIFGLRYALVGSVLIVGCANDEGELTSLTKEDIEIIEKNITVLRYTVHGKPIVHHCLMLDE